MARTVRNPLELRTPVRTISSVMRNAPRQQFRPTELDFGDDRPARGDRGGRDNFTSVIRSPRETISGGAPVSQGVTAPVSRGTTTAGAPVARVQTGTSRAPQGQAKPPVTSTIKAPAAKPVAAKPTAAKPAATKTTTALKPAATKTPVAAKTTAKTPVAAKTTTTKAPIAAKTTATTTKPVATTKPVTTTTTKPTTATTTKPSSSLTSTIKNALVGAGTAALINNLVKKPTSPVSPVVKPPVSPPKPPVSQPPVSPKPPVVKPPVVPPVVKPPVVKPPVTSVVKPPVSTAKPTTTAATKAATAAAATKAATTGATGTTGTLTDDQIQAELDRARDEGATGLPEGAVANEDGTYSVTADGMTTTYAADGSIIGMEASDTTVGGSGEDTVVAGDGTDTTSGLTRSLTGTGGGDTTLTTGADTSAMTDLGEGYFADADGNIYGADGNLMYTVGADGEYVDANATGTTTAEETTYTDPETGLTWNLGADGNWTQEGFGAEEEVTTWQDPETGFTWNLGSDGQWTQEGFEDVVDDTLVNDTVVDGTVIDDGSLEDYSSYVDDGTDYEDNAKGGSIVKKYKKNARRFEDGGLNTLGYGEDEGYSDTGEEVQDFQNLTNSGTANVQNTELNDNGDGTYSYFDGSEYVTIDDTGYELYRTDENGNVVETEAAPMARNLGVTTEGDDYGNTIVTDADGNRTVYDPDGNILSEGDPNARYPVDAVTSSGSGQTRGFAAVNAENQVQNQPDQTGILDSLLNAVRDNPGLAGGAVGALIASLMDQAGGSESAEPRQPVDISELTSFNPRTTDFGAGMVGGRTGTGSPLVSYADYAEDYGSEEPDDRLYSDLGISGWLREPDMADYRDEEGNLTDQSGNLVDEYGYLLDDGSGEYVDEEAVPEEETAVEDAYETEEEPTMATGGSTHYTFGRVMNPADNLGIGMKKGGLSQAHTVHSHHTNPVIDNRVDFRKGSAVNGAGDGQSDDIPAWLADGEYVMDAELVSMLGNGSNKAGAKILDKFREDVRAHKRSAPLGKIPPKAKSPLNYLKESMNG